MSSVRKNYPAIDIAKFLCALVVLFYHYFSEIAPAYWLLEEALSIYAVAVALFMALSGFLVFDKIRTIPDRREQWKIVLGQAKRILTIYAIWSIPYVIFQIASWDMDNVTIQFIARQIWGWTIGTTFCTIWFLPVLAAGLVLAFFFYTCVPWKALCILCGALYLIGSMQQTYYFIGEKVPVVSNLIEIGHTWLLGARGSLFFGMPLIILGAAVTKIQWRNTIATAIISVIMLAALLAEALTLRMLVGGCGLDIALFMVPTVLSLILFLISFSWTPKHKSTYTWMRSMSVLVFVTQRLFLIVIPYYLTAAQKQILFANSYVGAAALCGGTILFSALIIHLTKKWPRFKVLY